MKSRVNRTASGPCLLFATRPLALLIGSISLAAGSQSVLADAAATDIAAADAANTAVKLKTIVVKDRSDSDDAYVARHSHAGTKTNASIAETPQSISVINSTELENRNVGAITDALLYTPGTSVNAFGFDPRGLDWIILRGFDAWYTGNFRDGMNQTPGLMFMGTQTEIYGLERIEILRGPASVLFGKGDVGGIVNRVSKLPSDSPVREVVAQVGSHERKQLAADWGGSLDKSGAIDYRVVGVVLDTNTQEEYPNGDDTMQERQYFAPSLRWQIAEKTSLILQAEILRDEASDDIQYVTDFNGEPTDVKEGDPDYSKIENTTDAIGYQFSHELASGWSVQQKLRNSRRTMDKHHILSWFADDGVTLEREARFDEESVDELTIDTSTFGDVDTGSIKHTLLFGIDWDDSTAKWERHTADAPSLDLNNPDYDLDIPEPHEPGPTSKQDSRQLGFYAQDQIRFDAHWLLTVGARHDRVETELDDEPKQTDNVTTGRIGLSYIVGNGWAPYISYAESFLPNIGVDEDTGEEFDPSRGKQTEVGIKYIPDNKPVSFTAAVFDLKKTNVVSYDPFEDRQRQAGEIESKGIELEVKAELNQQLNLTASYTRLDMEVLESVDSTELGQFPMLIPEDSASLLLDYTVSAPALKGLGFLAGARYIGKRWNDPANTSSQPSYTLFDAGVHYAAGPWRFELNATNVFDKEYLAARAYDSHLRGDERNVLFTVKYDF